jgi:hypothetical protein
MARMSIRITGETCKQVPGVRARAHKARDLPLVRRVSALLAIGRGEAAEAIAASSGVSPSSVYGWLHAFLVGAWSGCGCSGAAAAPRS